MLLQFQTPMPRTSCYEAATKSLNERRKSLDYDHRIEKKVYQWHIWFKLVIRINRSNGTGNTYTTLTIIYTPSPRETYNLNVSIQALLHLAQSYNALVNT